jgi:SAM-dependent methyltransferase
MNETDIKTLIAVGWDKDSAVYDTYPFHGMQNDGEKQEWLKLLQKLVGEKPCSILDVDAGAGFLSLLLCELGHTCRGIDLSEGMLVYTQEKAKIKNIRNISIEAQGERLTLYAKWDLNFHYRTRMKLNAPNGEVRAYGVYGAGCLHGKLSF